MSWTTCSVCEGPVYRVPASRPAIVCRSCAAVQRAALLERACEGCGVTMNSRDKRKKFCSRQCANARSGDGSAAKGHKARAIRFGVAYESIKPAIVYERDEWVCGLCHGVVDPSIRYPDMRCASIDHIIPMSQGGSHTYDNVQLAHLDCNIAKGAGPCNELVPPAETPSMLIGRMLDTARVANAGRKVVARLANDGITSPAKWADTKPLSQPLKR